MILYFIFNLSQKNDSKEEKILYLSNFFLNLALSKPNCSHRRFCLVDDNILSIDNTLPFFIKYNC